MPKEFRCPSGAMLKIYPAPFKDAKALHQAILKEGRSIEMKKETELGMLVKEVLCASFSSPEVEKALWDCLSRCTYNSGNGDLKIDESTFEPESTREDYTPICMEVTKENCLPFAKGLFAEFQRLLAMTGPTQA